MGEMENVYDILIRKCEENTKPRCRRWDNIEIKIIT
jgi:hypothetical protein